MHRLLPLIALLVIGCTATVEGERERDATPSPKDTGGSDTRFLPSADTTQPRGDGPVAQADVGPTQDSTPPSPDGPVVDPCAGVSCSGHGECAVVADQALCECELYYKADGLNCVPACTGVTCPDGKTCIPGHHNQTDPLCVDTCDCSNCGNCDVDDIPSYGVSYCGNVDGSPATVTCTKPCPGGQACIPFSTPICWPGQGCISL